MIKKYIICLVLLSCNGLSFAQVDSIERILQQIEQNNNLLQAARHDRQAQVLENKADNNLPDPTVNYSYLYGKRSNLGETDELTVTQGFDFPTAYATRSKYNRLQAEAYSKQYELVRRDLLLQAKQLCMDLIDLNRQKELLQSLWVNSDSLVQLYDTRLNSGDATILELNKVKMGHMTIQAELADNKAAYRAALQKLLIMNGNQPFEFNVSTYPVLAELPSYEVLCDDLLPVNSEVLQVRAESEAAREQVAVSRAGWLPKLEVGYRRNTAPGEEFNGFIVGGSLPLFENNGKVKAAKAKRLSAELKRDDATLKAEADLLALYNEARQLQDAMAAYDIPLMNSTLQLLGKALHSGQFSLSEYYIEVESIIRKKQDYMQLENRYQKLMAEIYADTL